MPRPNTKTASTAAASLRGGFTLILCALAAACTSSERRQENENTTVKNELSRETQRVCALPAGERQGEIDRLLRDSGLVVVCPVR